MYVCVRRCVLCVDRRGFTKALRLPATVLLDSSEMGTKDLMSRHPKMTKWSLLECLDSVHFLDPMLYFPRASEAILCHDERIACNGVYPTGHVGPGRLLSGPVRQELAPWHR